MSKERAVQVVALDGVICTDEHDYNRACQQLEQCCAVFRQAQQRIIKTWYREHYPDLRIRFKVSPSLDLDSGAFNALVTYYVENPQDAPFGGIQRINNELSEHLKRIRAMS